MSLLFGVRRRRGFPTTNAQPYSAKHCFLEAGNGNEISFVEFDEPVESVNPPSFFQVWPVGMHHHMAYRCESEAQLMALREQIKNFGTPVSKVVDHQFIKSIYFTDPSGYNLELTWTYRGYKDSEYDLTILNRKLRPDENVHENSDKHGKNVAKAGAIPKAKL